jgi:cytoskeletal protein CcmA (bactofilin family)
MLGSNSKERKSMAVDNVLNTIARGTILEGKITTKGDIRVEGKVIGTISCDAKLVIGEHGSVEGFVDARNAYIAGQVKGEVVVRELLQLQEKGRIEGDIYTQKLSVQIGASFSGNCRMGDEAQSVLGKAKERAEEYTKDQGRIGNGAKRTIFSGNSKRPAEPASPKIVNEQQEASA